MEFRILGPLEIRQNGRALPCKGAKQRLLLATLLLHANEVVSNDRLIDVLWGEKPPPTANKALQVHVSQLRRALDADVIRTRPPGYQLDVVQGELDLQIFEALAADGRRTAEPQKAAALLAEALALWRGAPLADLSYEEALQPDIARLEELRLAALEDRINADLACGRHAELIAELEQLSAEHPLRERIRGQLMLALYRVGRAADALEVYAETRRRLVDELGLEPGRELKALQQQILEQDQGLELQPAAEAPTGGLLGREREFSDLAHAIDGALAGRGAVALVGGEPGIGKSRLADAAARHAAGRGARVAVGRCWEAGGAPAFWPWIQALRTLLRDSDLDALTDLTDRPSGDETEAARFMMFESIARLLRSAAAEAPLAIFLDDIHAADAPSLLLLRFVAADLAQHRIAVVGCYRDTEVGPELAETLAELAREPVVIRLALKGLGAESTATLLASTMGEAPSAELAGRVQAETHGNPLFAGELGRLFATEGVPAGERLPIPEGVREAITLRLRRQSQDCRDVLALAAVAGREFDPPLLAAVSNLPPDGLGAALDEARAAGVIDDIPGAPRLRFSHILVRDALYYELPAPRRMAIHRAVADALTALGASAPEIAHHYLEGGPEASPAAVEFALAAARGAESQHAYEEAARHYESALELLEEPQTRCEVLLSMAEALSRAGQSTIAKKAVREGVGLAEEHGWPEQIARGALAYGGRFAWARGSTDPFLVPLLQRALEAIGNRKPLTRARLLARLAAALRDEPLREGRLALAQEALDLTRDNDDLMARAYAVEGYWIAAESAASIAEGLAVGDELIDLGRRLGDREHEFTGRDFRVNAFWKRADRAGVDVEMDELTKLAEELRQPAWRWWVRTTRVGLTLMEGRFDEAEQVIRETRRFGEQAERWNAHVSERLQLFVLKRAQGRLAEIEDVMARSTHEYPSLLRFAVAEAHLHAELGNQRQARAAFDLVMARDLANEHVDGEWLFTLAMLPEISRFLGDEEAAQRLYSLLRPHPEAYAQAPVEAAFGSCARVLGVLATMLGFFDEAEGHFDTALEIERRMRARPWVAHVRHDYAALLAARGERERASEMAAAAAAAYEALGMKSWAARARAL
jgi:DNA-binding SARP family transcriptional activator/tetratricopeptide (TPR) repeat protein